MMEASKSDVQQDRPTAEADQQPPTKRARMSSEVILEQPSQQSIATSQLLCLPREIRDEIYRLVLVEPPADRRFHQPGCFFYSELRDDWDVPFFLHHIYSVDFPVALFEPIRRRYADCRIQCLRRKGLGLLGVSRQVYVEAQPIFWQENALQFHNYDEILKIIGSYARVGLSGSTRCDLIHRLSLHQSTMKVGPIQTSVIRLLKACKNLREVTLPPDLVCELPRDFADNYKMMAVRVSETAILDSPTGKFDLYLRTQRAFNPDGGVYRSTLQPEYHFNEGLIYDNEAWNAQRQRSITGSDSDLYQIFQAWFHILPEWDGRSDWLSDWRTYFEELFTLKQHEKQHGTQDAASVERVRAQAERLKRFLITSRKNDDVQMEIIALMRAQDYSRRHYLERSLRGGRPWGKRKLNTGGFQFEGPSRGRGGRA